MSVEELIPNIGRHPGLDQRQLTLPELGALVVVAGIENGFEVELEVPCCDNHPKHKVDCLWRAPRIGEARGRVIVAWEFDGRDARRAHLLGGGRRLGTITKLSDTRAPVKVQALFSVRNGELDDRRADTQEAFENAGIDVYLDTELVTGRLMEIIGRAITAR